MLKKYFPYLFFLLLLVVSCNTSPEVTIESESTSEFPLFESIPSSQSGINFNNHIQENFKNFFAKFNYVYNGAGVGIGDINNDGLADIYFTGNEVANKLYLNEGDFKFKDITATAKVDGGGGWHNGVVMADVNADGWLDIYISRGGWESPTEERKNLLFINNQDLTFTESAAAYGLADEGYSLQAAFFDIENDGDLDMYLTNRPNQFFLGYQKVLEGKKKNADLNRDKLYRNDDGKFTEIGLRAGIVGNFGYGLGLVTSDVNKDGFVDIYVANDYLENDYFYLNQGDGTFKEKIKDLTRHVPFYAMGVDAVDINNDGWEDLIELEMLPSDYVRSKTTMASMNPQLFNNLVSNGFQPQYMHNMLQLNQGRVNEQDVFFSEISQLSGIAKTDWSWACLGSDFDNDGWRDIFITNGFRRDIWDKDANAKFKAYLKSPQRQKSTDEENAQYITNLFQPNKIENYVFQNNGDLSFTNQSKNWGLDEKSFSNGAAVGDLDNDGDLDVVVNNIEGDAFIYKNKAEKKGNHFIKVKLEGSAKNPFGLGAKVTVRCGEMTQYHDFKTVRGYLSSVEPLIHFGIGKNKIIDEIKVQWQTGKVSTYNKVSADQLLTINIQESQSPPPPSKQEKKLFAEVTNQYFQTPFIHQENNYDDYKDQILLPHKLSQTGPCIAVGDVDGDGLEDFYVGGASGQSGQLYFQKNDQIFQTKNIAAFQNDKVHEDVGATFFDADGDGDLDLYVVSGGNEKGRNPSFYQDRLYVNEKGNFRKTNNLPIILSSGSCVVSHDMDGDGDLDLFVGGRVSVAKYPVAPRNYLLENKEGKFKNVTQLIAPELSKIGMVTGAVWADIDQDEVEELVVVGEWMPITIFQKENKKYKNVTEKFGLSATTGWWNTLISTDYDKDGDPDFVLGNLGLNYKFQASEEKPFVIFSKDFDENGTNDVFLAKYNDDDLVPVRGKECSSQQLPRINKKFPTYRKFAESNIHDILGGETKDALKYEAKIFSSGWLKNQDGKLIFRDFPLTAQFSAVNGILAKDINGDGKTDIILAGNKYESEVETTRADAALGNVLVQNGKGAFENVVIERSGFSVPFDVKTLRAVRLGKDGKLGVLVGINNGALKLFRLEK